MTEEHFRKLTYCIVSMAVFFEIGHLLWEHLNGGIVSHHLLNRSDYPAISNWWGLLILPFLAWFAMAQIKKRVNFQSGDSLVTRKLLNRALIGFVGMLMLSILQSVSFTIGYGNIAIYLSLGLFVVGLFLPIYRAECIFGYVWGSILFTGAIIPLIGILVIAAVSMFADLCIKPFILRIIKPLSQ
ncbi:hypothetical protein [uncultured Shewanella sp.]|uniref:hypothetical protein n=1 Tax=uncultured Shewanella sp. TaxID=173975 RepID=UPI002636313D|nr:hypothetical protein [uncultured Shewanella sp.]